MAGWLAGRMDGVLAGWWVGDGWADSTVVELLALAPPPRRYAGDVQSGTRNG